MFDLIIGTGERPLRERAPGSKLVSIALHTVLLAIVIGIPLLTATNSLPQVPDMLAFVTPDTPAAPPPPPAPAARVATPAKPLSEPAANPLNAAPVDAPQQLTPEQPVETTASNTGPAAGGGVEGGVAGGIEGGVVGGVTGGMIGGVVEPAPPPPPAPTGPVRVGGRIKTPALLHRVEPLYPDLAAQAHIAGIVILEASVGTDGCVQTVKVLRSAQTLLDRAATDALKQWQYSPLVLNGNATPFVLTVTFTFSAK